LSLMMTNLDAPSDLASASLDGDVEITTT
jgi:hypothetical protein